MIIVRYFVKILTLGHELCILEDNYIQSENF